jgi:hypothetical protein
MATGEGCERRWHGARQGAVHRGRLEVSAADRAVLIELLDLAQSMKP